MSELSLKEAIEILKNRKKECSWIIRQKQDNWKIRTEELQEALSIAISKLQLLEQVEKDGIKKRECLHFSHCDCQAEGFNEAIDLSNAEFAKRLEGIENVIVNSKYRNIFQDTLINAGFPGDTFKMAKDLSQAIIAHLTKKEAV